MRSQPCCKSSRGGQNTLGLGIEARGSRLSLARRLQRGERVARAPQPADAAEHRHRLRTEDDQHAGQYQQTGDDPNQRIQHLQALGYAARRMAGTYKSIAVVTGASSGIGAASARALAERGYTVVGGARRVDRVTRAVGASGLALELDVTERESVDRFVGEVRRRFGRVDVLINNAGGALGLEPLEKAKDEDWTGMWNVNVFGLMLMTRACLPLLRKAKVGHIVNIGSIAGVETYKGGAGYTSVT